MYLVIISILIISAILIVTLKNKTKQVNSIDKNKNSTAKQEGNEINDNTTQIYPYTKKLLLTKNEWIFYKQLKIIADEMILCVLAKIRLADLIDIKTTTNSDRQKYFNKISRKHVDFALARPENLQILLLIELDDNSHKNQIKRDIFIEELCQKVGYRLLRTYGTAELKESIINSLKM